MIGRRTMIVLLTSLLAVALVPAAAVAGGRQAVDRSPALTVSTGPIGPTATCAAGSAVLTSDTAVFDSLPGKILRRSPNRVLTELDPPLPPGWYVLSGGSYDGYTGRAQTGGQTTESWVAEFRTADGRLLDVSDPSADLDDGPGFEEANWEGPIGSVFLTEPAHRIEVRHADPDGRGADSVHPVCLGYTFAEEPSLESILLTRGFTDVAEVFKPQWPGGSYEVEILAEFTSGHATNALGFFTGSSQSCTIVFDGPEGGPGLVEVEPKPIDPGGQFGLCLSGEGPAVLHTDPGRNPGELPASRVFQDLTHPNSFLVGFEDHDDGDFQDLVVRLTQPMPDAPLAGLPPAWPRETVPWDGVDDDWMLALVRGELDEAERQQPEGIYLVNPDGGRWVVHTEQTSPPVDVLTRILDWSPDSREALVLTTGPRDIEQVDLFNLETGRRFGFSGLLGPAPERRASFLPRSEDVLAFDLGVTPTDQLIQMTRDRQVIATYGPSVPDSTRVDWITEPSGDGVVVLDGLAVGAGPGRVIRHLRSAGTETLLESADCVPLRWLRAGELVAACDDVAPTTGTQLWVIPLDDVNMWPLVHPEALDSLNIEGVDDVHLSGGSAYLEDTSGGLLRLDEGCRLPVRLNLPAGAEGGDLVGVVDRDAIIARPGQLVRADLTDGSVRELLGGIVDVARRDAEPMTSGRFPRSPDEEPAIGSGTCTRTGPGDRALLTDVRWGRHPDFTRVVFEFEQDAGTVPGWSVGYQDGPVFPETPPGPAIDGDGLLKVFLTPSSRVDLSDPGGDVRVTYDGPSQISVGDGTVDSITLIEDFEAVLEWLVVAEERRPFTVFTLSGPPRLVIDIAVDE